MNVFNICDKCKATNIKTLMPKLKQIDNQAIINVGCQNFCGIGRTKSFCIVNGISIIGESEDDLITKIKEFLKN